MKEQQDVPLFRRDSFLKKCIANAGSALTLSLMLGSGLGCSDGKVELEQARNDALRQHYRLTILQRSIMLLALSNNVRDNNTFLTAIKALNDDIRHEESGGQYRMDGLRNSHKQIANEQVLIAADLAAWRDTNAPTSFLLLDICHSAASEDSNRAAFGYTKEGFDVPSAKDLDALEGQHFFDWVAGRELTWSRSGSQKN